MTFHIHAHAINVSSHSISIKFIIYLIFMYEIFRLSMNKVANCSLCQFLETSVDQVPSPYKCVLSSAQLCRPLPAHLAQTPANDKYVTKMVTDNECSPCYLSQHSSLDHSHWVGLKIIYKEGREGVIQLKTVRTLDSIKLSQM